MVLPFDELTSEQKQAFEDKLKKFHMDPAKVIDRICPSTFSGPIVLSADPAKSSIPPHYVTVNSIEDVKRIAGNPDEHYDNGIMEEHHDIPEPWPQELNSLAPGELTPEQHNRLLDAELVYIYGNSKHVASYKDAIDKHKFPATFTVFAAKEVCLDKTNSPFIIEETNGTGVVFGTVKVCAGGQIQFQGNATMDAQKMVKSDDTSCS